MANTRISSLVAGAALVGTDLFPDVQTVGAGPVKVTASQMATFFWASPTIVGQALGTPVSGTLTSCTGLPIGSGVSGLGAGVAAALAIAPNVSGGVLLEPASGGGTTNFLRADNTWAAPTGTTALATNTQTASYTLVLSDGINTAVEMNVAGANTLTVPPNASVAFPIGTFIEICQVGAD